VKRRVPEKNNILRDGFLIPIRECIDIVEVFCHDAPNSVVVEMRPSSVEFVTGVVLIFEHLAGRHKVE
jgi:hypothetical protein